jgi:predicted ArsR family transcriptional regulator
VKPLDLDGPRSKLVVQKILALITEQPLSKHNIAEGLGYHPDYLRVYLRMLVERGDIHVAGWKHERNNYPVKLYSPGHGKPARKPRKMTPSTRAKKYRARLRKEQPEEVLRRLLLTRAKRMKPKRDVAASWIGK